MYKIEFEVVSPIGLGGQFYAGENPNCKPDDVPDKYWHKTSRECEERPTDQYNKLKEWAETGEQLIRNVKMLVAPAPKWEEEDELAACMDDYRKLLALPPYDNAGNLVASDGIFAKSIENKYSDQVRADAKKALGIEADK